MALALLDRDHMENNGEPVRLLTLRQTAEALNVSPRTMLRLLWRNKLPAVKVGSQWRIRERDLINWLYDLEEL